MSLLVKELNAKIEALRAERDALLVEVARLKEPQVISAGWDELEAAEQERDRLRAALIDHHPCPSRCDTGCHNCRGTGYSQSPCLICAEALRATKEEP